MKRAGLAAVVIALADVALLASLLLVATRADEEASVENVHLADPAASDDGLSPRAVLVVVEPTGYAVGGQLVFLARLSETIAPRLAALREPIVVLRPAREATWEQVAGAMAAARAAGASRVELLGAPQ